VGHLGTLDPFASGLLPLGVNEGTKIADIFLTAPKSYSGIVALGVETDTQDATGRVLEICDVPQVGHDEIERLRLWPQGEAELGFEVTCSKGTYIRTLAADMGKFLGCGAHLKSLRRYSCGRLTLDRAVALAALEELRKTGKTVPMLSLNQALAHLREIRLEERFLARLKRGKQEALAAIGLPQEGEKMVRVVDSEDSLVALAEWGDVGQGRRWRLFRVFSEAATSLRGDRRLQSERQ
ncbi:MAG: hypothetical protein HYV04_16275, partial [Deltaproteobacteria bacterium]|nr:hypothetical protein [Deltaproteobacteria bacterium]